MMVRSMGRMCLSGRLFLTRSFTGLPLLATMTPPRYRRFPFPAPALVMSEYPQKRVGGRSGWSCCSNWPISIS